MKLSVDSLNDLTKSKVSFCSYPNNWDDDDDVDYYEIWNLIMST